MIEASVTLGCHNFRPVLLLAALLLCVNYSHAVEIPWETLSDGLELGIYQPKENAYGGDARITILRIDPKLWALKICSREALGYSFGLSTKEWAQRHRLSAVINAGMFLPDRKSHVGYMKVDEFINRRHKNHYQSAAAFEPYDTKEPAFQIVDLDTDTTLEALEKRYRYIVQNLRLIKRPAINRWSPQERKWNEAALAEDRQGRALFIYTNTPYSMHEFNELLLSLPIELVAAQHLEGGAEAQFYIQHGVVEIEENNQSIPFNLFFQQNESAAWPLPNVIGIMPRSSAAAE